MTVIITVTLTLSLSLSLTVRLTHLAAFLSGQSLTSFIDNGLFINLDRDGLGLQLALGLGLGLERSLYQPGP